MKKLFNMILATFLFVSILTGCGKTKYEFMQPIDNIEKIDVVMLGEIKNPYTEHEATLIKEISKDSIDDFLGDLNDCFW